MDGIKQFSLIRFCKSKTKFRRNNLLNLYLFFRMTNTIVNNNNRVVMPYLHKEIVQISAMSAFSIWLSGDNISELLKMKTQCSSLHTAL